MYMVYIIPVKGTRYHSYLIKYYSYLIHTFIKSNIAILQKMAQTDSIYFQEHDNMNKEANIIHGHHLSSSLEQLIEGTDDLRCGYGRCKPPWLQIFNNPKWFLVWLCYFSIVQGFIVNGVNNVNTTSIERRFNLPSAKVGMISSAYDFSAGILAIPIAYYGTYAHQPRMLAGSAFVMALGSFVMTMPHFTTGIYELGVKEPETCITAGMNISFIYLSFFIRIADLPC